MKDKESNQESAELQKKPNRPRKFKKKNKNRQAGEAGDMAGGGNEPQVPKENKAGKKKKRAKRRRQTPSGDVADYANEEQNPGVEDALPNGGSAEESLNDSGDYSTDLENDLAFMESAASKLSLNNVVRVKLVNKALEAMLGEELKEAVTSVLVRNVDMIVSVLKDEASVSNFVTSLGGNGGICLSFGELALAARKKRDEEMDFGREDLCEFTMDVTGASSSMGMPDSYTNIDYEVSGSIISAPKPAPQIHTQNRGGFGNISCFNCQGSHNMRQCRFPRDMLRIKANQKRQNLGSIGVDRYHTRKSFAEKYPNIRPGKFSPRLLHALGLRRETIPEFIYRMRHIGYPPGWLKAAEISRSGLEVFDEENREKGNSTSRPPAPKFNPGKIIDFVGFNVPMPRNWTDEHYAYNCPAMMNHNLKQNWGNFLQFSTQEVITGSLKANSPFNLKRPNAFPGRGSDGTEGNEKRSKDGEKLSGTPKETVLGTPVFSVNLSSSDMEESSKPVEAYTKLPELDKWMSGITDHIPYENLPGATGNYNLVKEVLKKAKEEKAASE